MKIGSILLSSFFVIIFPCPVNSLVCNRLREMIEEVTEGRIGEINCRFRLGASLRGGVGCTAKCVDPDDTACYGLSNGEQVCGRAYLKVSDFIRRRVEFEYGVLKGSGLIEGRLGRYSFMFRVCDPLNRFCGCQIVANGRPCFCAIVLGRIKASCPRPYRGEIIPLEEISPVDAARLFLSSNSELAVLFEQVYSMV